MSEQSKWIWGLPIVVMIGVCALAIGLVPGVRGWIDTAFPQLGIGKSQVASGNPDSSSGDSNAMLNSDSNALGLPQPTQNLPGISESMEGTASANFPAIMQNSDAIGSLPSANLSSQSPVQLAQANVPVSQIPTAVTPSTARLSQSTLPVSVPNSGINVPSMSSSGSIYVPGGKVMFPDDVLVAAQSDGNIIKLNVDEGTVVKANDLMIELDSRLVRAEEEVAKQELSAAKLKAEDDSSVRFARAASDVASKDVEISDELMSQGVVGLLENQQKRLELTKARLSVTNAENQKKQENAAVKVQEAKLGATGVQLELRQIRAPWAGVVSEVAKRQSSFVRAGDPIFRLTSMEKIRVTGLAKLNDAPHTLVNLPARVTIQYALGKSETMEGRVLAVAPRSTADSSTYKIWIEVNNKQTPDGQYLFREGMDAAVEIIPRR